MSLSCSGSILIVFGLSLDIFFKFSSKSLATRKGNYQFPISKVQMAQEHEWLHESKLDFGFQFPQQNN